MQKLSKRVLHLYLVQINHFKADGDQIMEDVMGENFAPGVTYIRVKYATNMATQWSKVGIDLMNTLNLQQPALKLKDMHQVTQSMHPITTIIKPRHMLKQTLVWLIMVR